MSFQEGIPLEKIDRRDVSPDTAAVASTSTDPHRFWKFTWSQIPAAADPVPDCEYPHPAQN
jgi:hypothetical protein